MLAAAVAEDEPFPLRAAAACGKRLLEPLVLIGEVVGDDVDRDAQPTFVGRGDQRVEVAQGPEQRIDIAGISDVVPAVGHGGPVERREPQGVDAQFGEVVQALAHADEIAGAVTVSVGKTSGINLVEDGTTPPWLIWGHPDDSARRPGTMSLRCRAE